MYGDDDDQQSKVKKDFWSSRQGRRGYYTWNIERITYIFDCVLDRTAPDCDELFLLAAHVLRIVDWERELRKRQEGGQVGGVEGGQDRDEYPPAGEQYSGGVLGEELGV